MSTKTWFKSLVAAVCVGATFGLYAAANSSDSFTAEWGGVQKIASEEVVMDEGPFDLGSLTKSLVQDATVTRTVTSHACGTDEPTWVLSATLVAPELNPSDVAEGKIRFRFDGRHGWEESLPAVDTSDWVSTNGCKLASEYDEDLQRYVITVTKEVTVADMRRAVRRDSSRPIEFMFSVDWDKNAYSGGIFENNYVLSFDVAQKLATKKGPVTHTEWDMDYVLPIAATVSNEVGKVEGNVITVDGTIKDLTTAFAFSFDDFVKESESDGGQLYCPNRLVNAYYRVSDNYGNWFHFDDSKALVPFYTRRDRHHDQIKDMSSLFTPVMVDDAIKCYELASKTEGVYDFLSTALLDGVNYVITFEFDMNGDSVYETKYDLVFDVKNMKLTYDPYTTTNKVNVAGAKVEDLLFHKGVVDGRTVTYSGREPELIQVFGQDDELPALFWKANIKITAPDWYTNETAKIKAERWSYAFSNSVDSTAAYITWNPRVTVADLNWADENGVEKTLEVDWDGDGYRETVYTVKFAKDLVLYKGGNDSADNADHPSYNGYSPASADQYSFYPMLKNKESYLATASSTYTNCTVVNGQVTFNGIVNKANYAVGKDTSISNVVKAWSYKFRVYAPEFVCNSVQTNQVKLLDQDGNIISRDDQEWGRDLVNGYWRYYVDVTRYTNPKDLMDLTRAEKDYAVVFAWDRAKNEDGEFIHTTTYTIHNSAKDITLLYVDGTRAWPMVAGDDAFKSYTYYYETNVNSHVEKINDIVGIDGETYKFGRKVDFNNAEIVQDEDGDFYIRGCVLMPTTVNSNNYWLAGIQYWDSVTEGWVTLNPLDYSGFNGRPYFTSAVGDISVVEILEALKESNRVRFDFDFDGVYETYFEFNLDYSTLKLFWADGTKAYPLDDSDWKMDNQPYDLNTGYQQGNWTVTAKDGATFGGAGTFKQTGAESGDHIWKLCSLLVNPPVECTNHANNAQMGLYAWSTNLVPQTRFIDNGYMIPVEFSFYDFSKAYYGDKKIRKTICIQWMAWGDVIEYPIEIDITNFKLYYANGDQAFPLDESVAPKFERIDGDAVTKVEGQKLELGDYVGFYDADYGDTPDLRKDVVSFRITAGSTLNANNESIFKRSWNVDHKLVKDAAKYIWNGTNRVSLAALEAARKNGEKISRSYWFDWNFNAERDADKEVYTVEIDPERVTLTNHLGQVVYPFDPSATQIVGFTDATGALPRPVSQVDGGFGIRYSNVAINKFNFNVWTEANPRRISSTHDDVEGEWICGIIKKPANAAASAPAKIIRTTGFPAGLPMEMDITLNADNYQNGTVGDNTTAGYYWFEKVSKDDLQGSVTRDNTEMVMSLVVDWNDDGIFETTYTMQLDNTAATKVVPSEGSWLKASVEEKGFRNADGTFANVQTNYCNVFEPTVLDALSNEHFRFDGWFDPDTHSLYPTNALGQWVITERGDYPVAKKAVALWAPYVLSINGVPHVLPEQPLNLVKPGDVIKLLRLRYNGGQKNPVFDVDQYVWGDVTGTEGVVLDLDGKTLTLGKWQWDDEAAANVWKGGLNVYGNLIISNGTIRVASMSDDGADYPFDGALHIGEGGIVTLSDVKVVSEDAIPLYNVGTLNVLDDSEILVREAPTAVMNLGTFNLDGAVRSDAKITDNVVPAGLMNLDGEANLNGEISVEKGTAIWILGGKVNGYTGSYRGISAVYVRGGEFATPAGSTAMFAAIAAGTVGAKAEWSREISEQFACQYTADAVFADGGKLDINGGAFASTDGEAIAVYGDFVADGTQVKAATGAFWFRADLPVVNSALYDAQAWDIDIVGGDHYEFLAKTFKVVEVDLDGGSLEGAQIDNFTVESTGALPVPVKDGFDFVGYIVEDNESVVVTTYDELAKYERDIAKLTAKWVLTEYVIEYKNLNDVDPYEFGNPYSYRPGETALLKPLKKRGWQFLGWFLEDGTEVDQIADGVKVVFARWSEVSFIETIDQGFTAEAAYTYYAILVDANDQLKGTMTLKTTKANARTLSSTLTATVKLTGTTTSATYKGTTQVNGEVAKSTLTRKSGREEFSMSVDQLGDAAFLGTYEGCKVYGARALDKNADQSVIRLATGNWTIALENDDQDISSFQVAVTDRAKVTIKGTLFNGTAFSQTTDLIRGEGCAYAPFVSTKKDIPFAFVIWFSENGIMVSHITPFSTETEDKVVAAEYDGAAYLAAGDYAAIFTKVTATSGLTVAGVEYKAVAADAYQGTVANNKLTAAKYNNKKYWSPSYTYKTGAVTGTVTLQGEKNGRAVTKSFTLKASVVGGVAYGTIYAKDGKVVRSSGIGIGSNAD